MQVRIIKSKQNLNRCGPSMIQKKMVTQNLDEIEVNCQKAHNFRQFRLSLNQRDHHREELRN